MRNKSEWQTTIRNSRREYYKGLSENEKNSFLKHIWSIRIKKDYQSYSFWKKLFPDEFISE